MSIAPPGLPSRVVLLCSGSPVSLKVLYCLRSLGITTDVIDWQRKSITRHSRYRRYYLHLGPNSGDRPATEDSLVAALNQHIIRYDIDGLIGGDLEASGMLCSIAGRLPRITVFPCSSAQKIQMLDNKWTFHQFLETNGIPCPDTRMLESLAHLEEIASSLSYPLIVKPLTGESSYGIKRFDNLDDLSKYLHSGVRYSSTPLLLQEYMPGSDADVSFLAREGEILCHTMHTREGGCILRFFESEAVLDIARSIAAASKFNGVANVDLRICPHSRKVTVLECNPRFWYTLQASMWKGVNFVEEGFRHLQDMERKSPNSQSGVYILHGCLVKKHLWNPASWYKVETGNFKGLFQAISDPMPFLRT